VATVEDAMPEHVRLHGLDPDRSYRVRVRDEIGPSSHGFATPAWLSRGEVTVSGRVLSLVGLQIPPLWPGQAIVLHVTARSQAGSADQLRDFAPVSPDSARL